MLTDSEVRRVSSWAAVAWRRGGCFRVVEQVGARRERGVRWGKKTCKTGRICGRSLKPVVDGPNPHKRKRRRKKRRYARTFQRHILAKEARRTVLVAQKSGRGISMENPERLPRWGGWAARQFAKRVELLSGIAGVAVRLLKPAYSSQTCSRCTSRDTFRKKTFFRCHTCGFTRHADENAALNLSSGLYAVTGISHGSLSQLPLPSGGGAVE